MIIDAHVHLPVGEQFHTLQEKKEHLYSEMQNNYVDKCVVIADSWPDSEIGTTEELVSLFCPEENSRVLVIGGISPLVSFDKELSKLRMYLERGQIAGIKLYTGHESFYLTDNRLTEVYKTAIRYHVPVLFHSGWDHAEYGDPVLAAEITRRYPDLILVCCHCWYPQIESCMRLTDRPNLYFDLSSVADNATVLDSISAKVKALIERVPDRVVFGSDSFGCSMQEHIRFIRNLHLSPETEQKVFSGNARKLYQL